MYNIIQQLLSFLGNIYHQCIWQNKREILIHSLKSHIYLQYNVPKMAKSAIVSLLPTRYVMGPRTLLRYRTASSNSLSHNRGPKLNVNQ